MNLPNKLTVLRVLMIPFFVVFMLTDIGGSHGKYISLALFALASLTERLPGNTTWLPISGSLWIPWQISFWSARP